uniref:Large ribosomal subunit protein uL22c n=1 Tax=Choreocolax polysiphoniae TaxID=282351 RepID=A0A0B5W3A0_9FLOR|nr:50S ribosomal protein L22 [Choreocolax polysiphoniae]AJH65865.1 50S ribosomal protein L22 [Choreocolax polysiphoniae]
MIDTNKIKYSLNAKYIKLSTYKSQRVLKQIQGKNYSEVKLILDFMPYKACKIIIKLLEVALNNLSQKTNNMINKNRLLIKEAFINKGPTIKRFRPRALGKTFLIHKLTCHITIKIEIQ